MLVEDLWTLLFCFTSLWHVHCCRRAEWPHCKAEALCIGLSNLTEQCNNRKFLCTFKDLSTNWEHSHGIPRSEVNKQQISADAESKTVGMATSANQNVHVRGLQLFWVHYRCFQIICSVLASDILSTKVLFQNTNVCTYSALETFKQRFAGTSSYLWSINKLLKAKFDMKRNFCTLVIVSLSTI